VGGEVRVSAALNSGVVQLTVSDNGIGIPEEHFEKVFELFFTTNLGGDSLGLGLSAAYHLVENIGGTIGFRKQVKGACAVVRFPQVFP
jgi:signal transduction histidine kinase